MPLLPCPACGREVSAAAAACPQCGQPIVGAVMPPPLPRVEFPSVPRAQRADAQGAGWMTYTALALGACVVVALVMMGRSPAPARDPVRDAAADAIKRSSPAFEFVTWQGNTLQVVMARPVGDATPMADAACNALRGQGVRGSARVMVLERNAYLNSRRDVLSEASCDLPR